MDTPTTLSSVLPTVSTPILDLSPASIEKNMRPLVNISVVVFAYFWTGFVAGHFVNRFFPITQSEKSTQQIFLETSIQIALTNVAAHFVRKFVSANLPAMDLDGAGVVGGGVLFAAAMLAGQPTLTANLQELSSRWSATIASIY